MSKINSQNGQKLFQKRKITQQRTKPQNDQKYIGHKL